MITSLISLFSAVSFGQLPITHIYSFEWTSQGDSFAVSNAKLWSGENLNGYNNQPQFTGADEFALTLSWHVDASTDIYTLHMGKAQIQPITNTMESEYSPRQIGDHWYCVRVDSTDAQHLWAYPNNGADRGTNILPGVNNVGYFRPLGRDSVVVFLTGEPHELAIYNLKNGRSHKFSSNIGRTFHVHEEGVFYVHKTTPEAWYIKVFDLSLKRSRTLTRTLDGVEDFVIHEGSILATKGSQVHRFRLGGKTWEKVLDLSPWGLKNITRMESNDKYLLCVEKVE